MSQMQLSPWWKLATGMLVVYWILLFAGTHLPRLPVQLPSDGGDKLAHFVGFAGLAFLLSWVWSLHRPLWPWGVCFATLVAALYGVFDELTQMLVPGRSAEWADWLADCTGALLGAATFCALQLAVLRLIHRRRALDVLPDET